MTSKTVNHQAKNKRANDTNNSLNQMTQQLNLHKSTKTQLPAASLYFLGLPAVDRHLPGDVAPDGESADLPVRLLRGGGGAPELRRLVIL